ncbi:tetratricopeptide repeat protein [Mucilaginibacter sp. S1162]|uniref:Tetratricopeptide repeat protein n=1 Tax=Mucilaginibacter humi TaxID=2732510 RepID=A0ABX1W5K8_9SPHI|nr:tetratricopeptide repeat protein [Mucilaginibacter humi]
MDPKNNDALFYRGNAYSNLKDYTAAIADYKQTIALDRKKPYVYRYRLMRYLITMTIRRLWNTFRR